jgi:ATP-dependent helicase/nuclease subunit A
MVLGEGSMQVSVMSGRSLAPSSVIPDTTGWHETNEDLSEWIAGWRNRTARDTAAQTFVPFLTPTGLQAWKGREARRAFLPDRKRARVLGTLAHRVLEQWNFAGDPAALPVRAEDLCRASLPGETSQDLFDLVSELSVMFTTFAGSEPYATLRGATILGREVPFKIPWPLAADGRACVMEGVIDVLYRLDGDLWIADYKTDRAKPDEVQAKVEEYRVQAEVYRQAVSQCLGHEKVRVKFIFLRSGHAIEVT